MITKQAVVTMDLGQRSASNTFIVDDILANGDVLITHPLAGGLLKRVKCEVLNDCSANLKDSTERCIDFARSNRYSLDHNMNDDLTDLSVIYAFNRRLTPSQKQILANICGVIAKSKFEDNIKATMKFITAHKSLLDAHNTLWLNNFSALFSGAQPITSKKQSMAIYNMAGYVLAELENPSMRRS